MEQCRQPNLAHWKSASIARGYCQARNMVFHQGQMEGYFSTMTALLEAKKRSQVEHGKPDAKRPVEPMQIGVDSFAARFADDGASLEVSASDSIRHLVERIELADQAGLDVFGVGEHHRREFLDSAPVLVLAAAAARTQRIRLTSAVTVLSAADPMRVFQEFAT